MRILSAGTDIQASEKTIWRVLVDFYAYPSWNPSVIRARGEVRTGAQLSIRVRMAWWLSPELEPEVISAEPGRELCWRATLFRPWLFQAEHRFLIERRSPDAVLFTQQEVYGGILADALLAVFGSGIHRGFAQMNQALKSVAESAEGSLD